MRKILLLILIFPVVLLSQELNATVNVNYEQLPTASKDKLQGFAEAIQNYLNQNKFTESDWEGDKIDCTFNIFFVSSGGELNYAAQVVVTSQRPIYRSHRHSLMLRIQDPSWKFQYEKNQILYFDPTVFNPLTSFLDFYAYVILGFDGDSFDRLGGSDYFTRAYDIAVLGSNSNASKGWQFSSGSYSRRALVEDLRNSQFEKFREDYFDYHYNGLDEYFSNKKKAQANIAKLVEDLYKVRDQIDRRSVLMKVFFNAKHAEIAEYLKDYPDKSIFEKLKLIDPPHISTYDKLLYGGK